MLLTPWPPSYHVLRNLEIATLACKARMMSQLCVSVLLLLTKQKTVRFSSTNCVKVGLCLEIRNNTWWSCLAILCVCSFGCSWKYPNLKGTGDEKRPTNVGKEIKVVKNKVAPPFKEAFIEIMYGEGISKQASCLKLRQTLILSKKSGCLVFFIMMKRLVKGLKMLRNILYGSSKQKF